MSPIRGSSSFALGTFPPPNLTHLLIWRFCSNQTAPLYRLHSTIFLSILKLLLSMISMIYSTIWRWNPKVQPMWQYNIHPLGIELSHASALNKHWKNPHWRKATWTQPIRIDLFSGRQFEGTFETHSCPQTLVWTAKNRSIPWVQDNWMIFDIL